MEIILLGIYSFFVWLIFIKFKWLPWNTTSKVTVVIIPIVALTLTPDPNAAPTTRAIRTGASRPWMRMERSRRDRRRPIPAISHMSRHISHAALSP